MDNELRDALHRVEPPEGFAERVMAKAAASASAKASADKPSRQAPPIARWAIAATILVALGGGAWYRVEERRREGEEAKRQVLASLNIAGSKLRSVQMKINHEQER